MTTTTHHNMPLALRKLTCSRSVGVSPKSTASSTESNRQQQVVDRLFALLTSPDLVEERVSLNYTTQILRKKRWLGHENVHEQMLYVCDEHNKRCVTLHAVVGRRGTTALWASIGVDVIDLNHPGFKLNGEQEAVLNRIRQHCHQLRK